MKYVQLQKDNPPPQQRERKLTPLYKFTIHRRSMNDIFFFFFFCPLLFSAYFSKTTFFHHFLHLSTKIEAPVSHNHTAFLELSHALGEKNYKRTTRIPKVLNVFSVSKETQIYILPSSCFVLSELFSTGDGRVGWGCQTKESH